MSYNRRPMQKRGGRIKNNFIDNISIRRSNPCHNMPYATATRSNISNFNSENNGQSVSDFYDDHKTLYILCKYYLGNFVTIKTETEEYNGVLRAVSPNGDFCLTEATVFVNQSELVSRYEKFKMIPIKDIKIVEAKNVDSNYSLNSLDQDKILTDEEIVKRRRSNNNMDHNQYDANGSSDVELTPFYDSSVPIEDNCLNASKVGAHWFPPEEMFEKNKISFNVKSTYNENLEGYTTQLNKEDPNFERDLIIAQKKALEIEKDRDGGMDHLENGDEENEELLFCSIVRSSESHKHNNDTDNQITNSHGKISQHIRNYTDHNVNTSSEDFIDQKHNLNPNAREFTPISSSVSYCDVNNITMQMNSMNIQNQNSFPNIVHPPNYIPYSIPVMFPHHMPNSVPIIQHPGMEQFLISRQNVITNYSIPPFFVPNQVSFDPNLINQTSSRFDNFQNSIQNEINYDRENISSEFEGRNESSEIENIQIHEEIKREDTDNQKKHISNEDFKVLKDSTSALHESQFNTGSNHNYELSETIPNYQKINSSLSCPNPRMFNQVVTGNPHAYIVPNVAHGIRHIGNYPQVVPNQISYIANYFPRQPSLIAPIHQVIPNMIPNPPQIHQSMQVPMKSLAPQNSNFPPGFPSNSSFVPVINPQINGQNFHTLLPGYPQSIPAAINAHLQIPIQHNMPQFSQFITPIQPCNYLNSMQLPPSQQN